MNNQLKNIILIGLIIYAFHLIFKKKKNENFTGEEMKKYPEMLKINCAKSTEIYNRLIKMNKERCIKKDYKIQRDTINNNTICYDDVAKEINAKLDVKSNCVMSDLINNKKKNLSTYKNLLTENYSNNSMNTQINNRINNNRNKRDTSLENSYDNMYNTQNLKVFEGPEFINKWSTMLNDSNKSDIYMKATLDGAFGSSNKYIASSPYDNATFSSDPVYLYQLSNYNKTKK